MDENKETTPDAQQIQPAESPVNPTTATQPPVSVVNGQPYLPVTQASNVDMPPTEKPSKWRYFFMFLGFIQIGGVAMFLLVMIWAGLQAKAGVSGTEFIALILFITVVPVVAIASLINLIGLPIYMRKHKPRGKVLTLNSASLVISLILAGFGIFSVVMLYAVPYGLNEKGQRESAQRQQAFEADNAKPEITKEAAIELLQTCQLKGFYYTDQNDKSEPANGGWGELSSTGVVLTKVEGKPYRISIADKLVPELVPIARAAQRTCGGPQFWHDGSYEQFKDGKWYFGTAVVHDTRAGKTKDEAITFMQNCKADYFVGYTADVGAVTDKNTKAWLEKAEKSTNGIEISEDGPKTYVFASKAMTAELQDTARKFRQSCYNTKKLYIVINDTIETEYPVGTWTKIKR